MYCAKFENSINLSENRMILCFDGQIRSNPEVEDQFQKLKDHGFLVIRSPGGFFPAAMKMADVLFEKDATVVVRDYCLSACANPRNYQDGLKDRIVYENYPNGQADLDRMINRFQLGIQIIHDPGIEKLFGR